MIDRTHRVGKKPENEAYSRPIIAKFTSFKHKMKLMVSNKNLKTISWKKKMPELRWGEHDKVFINDDLTNVRASIAAQARRMKKEGVIEDTWVRDGAIFTKKNGKVTRVVTDNMLKYV